MSLSYVCEKCGRKNYLIEHCVDCLTPRPKVKRVPTRSPGDRVGAAGVMVNNVLVSGFVTLAAVVGFIFAAAGQTVYGSHALMWLVTLLCAGYAFYGWRKVWLQVTTGSTKRPDEQRHTDPREPHTTSRSRRGRAKAASILLHRPDRRQRPGRP